MAQILPPKTSLGSEIGRGLGAGLQSGMNQANQVGFHRNLLQNALKNASDIAKDPNSSPLDRNLAFINAFAGIPGSERYVGQVLPMLNQIAAFSDDQNKNKTGSTDLNIPGTSTPGMQPAQGGQTPQENANKAGGIPGATPTQDAFPQEEVDLYEPFLGKGVKKYDPLDIEAVEFRDLQRGLQESPKANLMRKHNLEIENAVNRISNKQKEFAEYYNKLHPSMPADDQRIAQKFYRSKEALQAPTNEEKARKVDDLVDRYRALKTNIAKQLPRSLIGETREKQEKEVRNQIQWLLDEGQRDLAKEYITDSLQFGDSESERMINPPSENQENLLTKFPKFPELDTKVPTYGKTSRLFETYNKEREKLFPEYEKRLEEVIKPGTASKPGISLLVARDLAMETGLQWTEFNDMMTKLVNEKKIKLDPYQRQELPKLTNPPHAGFFDMFIGRK